MEELRRDRAQMSATRDAQPDETAPQQAYSKAVVSRKRARGRIESFREGARPPPLRCATSQNPPDYHVEKDGTDRRARRRKKNDGGVKQLTPDSGIGDLSRAPC
jgi:hypothetical protein